jgi:hypothetical protein
VQLVGSWVLLHGGYWRAFGRELLRDTLSYKYQQTMEFDH